MDAGKAEAEELRVLLEQARYFRGVLEGIEGRVSEIQAKAGKPGANEQNEK
jgi:hypothetical protein